jgi:hypothetical protein
MGVRGLLREGDCLAILTLGKKGKEEIPQDRVFMI